MGRIFVTGDLHGGLDMSKLNTRHFKADGLTKEDVLIVTGDVGLVWCNSPTEKFWLDFLDNKPWTTFCALGNHENYDEIENLPIVEMYGAPCYKVSESVYYAISGNIYTINGKKCLFVNGAESHDIFVDGKRYRYPHISWWKQESITREEADKAIENVKACGGTVDFVFSHTGGTEICKFLGFKSYPSDYLLSEILDHTIYAQHFCGHYHIDKTYGSSRIVYDDIILINTGWEGVF